MTSKLRSAPRTRNRLVSFAGPGFEKWLKYRQERKADRFDEVWNGVYVVMPPANNEHQELVGDFTFAFKSALISILNARVFPGCNISDDTVDWAQNFRCPDVAVFLAGNPAEDRHTHWLGGPDFAVEIVSKYDRSREKFGFYAKTGVREVMFIDRQPEWSLELFRRDGADWLLVGKLSPGSADSVASSVLPVSFRLLDGQPRPRIEVTRASDGQSWLA